jgi:hypothetical protein
MPRIFAILALAAFAAPAFACDNSSELPKYEREFRSQYKEDTASPATPYAAHRVTAMAVAGAALFVGATVVTLRRRGR